MSASAAAPAASYSAQAGSVGTAAAAVAITNDPAFRELTRQRNGLATTLSVVMMAIYLGFILLVAFDKPLLATKVGGTTSLGIVLGLVVIVAAIVLTGFYVVRANGRFDELTDRLVREHGR